MAAIRLKEFIEDLAEEKELKLHGYTKDDIRDVEREMEKIKLRKLQDAQTAGNLISQLKKNDELKKGFGGSEWGAIEKEIKSMLK